MQNEKEVESTLRTRWRYERIWAYAFGVVFLSVIIVLTLVVPEPTPFQFLGFKVVLALSAAGVAAMIPGFVQVEIPVGVQSGGALAIFAVVFFFNPATLVVESPGDTGADVSDGLVEIWGIVVEPDGSPLRGVRVEIRGDSVFVDETDSSGVFRKSVPPGSYDVVAKPEPHLQMTERVEATTADLTIVFLQTPAFDSELLESEKSTSVETAESVSYAEYPSATTELDFRIAT